MEEVKPKPGAGRSENAVVKGQKAGGTTPEGNVRPNRILTDSKLDSLAENHAQTENQHEGSEKLRNWGGIESYDGD